MKYAALLPALLLLVTACSSETAIDAADAPRDAEPQSFCAAYDPDADLRVTARDLADVGTPDDIPAAGRAGFVIFVRGGAAARGALAALTGDSSDGGDSDVSGMVTAAEELSGDPDGADRDAVAAFLEYARATCFA